MLLGGRRRTAKPPSGSHPHGKLLNNGRSRSPAPAEAGVVDALASNFRIFSFNQNGEGGVEKGTAWRVREEGMVDMLRYSGSADDGLK